MAMHMGGTPGEWADITIRPVTADGSTDRGPRRPRRWPPHDEDEPAEEAEVPITDSVTIGPARVAREGADRATLLRVALLPVRPLGVDLQTQWAALVEASTLQPAFRFWQPRRRDVMWRGVRRAARALPLGVPFTPCEALLSRQMPEQPARCACCFPGGVTDGREPPPASAASPDPSESPPAR